MRGEEIEGYLGCQGRVWESLRGVLPEEFVDRNLAWGSREGVVDAWLRVLEDPEWMVLVAVEGGSVVGVVQGRVDWSRLSSLGFLGVDEGYRRRGIGRGLVEGYVEESRLRGAAKVTLYTSPALRGAVKLYAEMGFVPEGFLKGHRLGVDMIVYSLFLE